MSKVVELFGRACGAHGVDWQKIITEQWCIFLNKRCYKIRKSDPS